MSNIPNALRKAINDNNLLLFVGAGLSYNLINIHQQPIKGWSHLVAKILSHLSDKGYDVAHLIPLVDRYDPIKVLDLIESDKILPKSEVYAFTKDFFDLDPDKNDLGLHKKLFQLSKKIITTNYDNAFELATRELGKHKAYKGKNYELTTHKDPTAPLLFKLHGCFEEADSMVLFPTNYDNLYANPEPDAEHSLLVLKNIIMNKSILFIGTGMGDFQINSIFQEIKKLQGTYNQEHFILTTKTLDSQLDFLTPITMKDHSEIDSIIDELIEFKKDLDKEETEEVIELRKQLEEANKKIEELQNTTDRDQLLEREAWKYFQKGLKLSLSEQYIEASQQYEMAVELNPNLHQAWNNWGNALGWLAKNEGSIKADKLYHKAFGKFNKAIQIKHDKDETWYNWGTYLGHFGNSKEGSEAAEINKQACEKFQKAVEIKSDSYKAWNNWGNALGRLAKRNQGIESKKLSLQAIDKYKKAIKIYPNKPEMYDNWGAELTSLAKASKGNEAEELFLQALDKLKKGVELGGNTYNLACFLALRGNLNEALGYLESSLKNKDEKVSFVEQDEDWKAYWNDKRFIALLDKYRE